MSANPRLDDFQRRHRWAGLPLAVVYKFFDDQGSYLTALITYYGFLSLFPLLLVGATILGFVLHGDHALQEQILHSVLVKFPIVGAKLQSDASDYSGSGLGLAIGLLTSLYGGLGVAQAAQNAMNAMYAVPRNERPNPFAARVRSLVLLATIGLGVLLTYAVSWSTSLLQGTWGGLAAKVASTTLYFLLFLVVFRVLTARDLSVRDVVLGAGFAALGWELLQVGGQSYINAHLNGASSVYGTFGLVLGLLAWIYLQALVIVVGVELNVVVRGHLWPRALLTPFTDDVNLTSADERSYTSYAQAQRHKGFERVAVDFDGHRTPRPDSERSGDTGRSGDAGPDRPAEL